LRHCRPKGLRESESETGTSIEGPGPFTDRHRRMRWTSDSTVTMVLDGAVVTIDVGTE
jgi:hypothetical protein